MRASLIALSGPAKGQTFELANGTITLGRHDSSSWQIADPAISRHHCRLEPAGEGVFEVIDLGSRTGTSVNGHQVKRALLAKGDLLAIGRSTLFFAARGLAAGAADEDGSLPDASTFLSTLLESGRLSILRKARGAAPAATHRLLGDSVAMAKVKELIAKVAPTPATALILGESGSGKELAARAVHEASPRGEKPFVAINCASLSENLLESELFGHEKGAFTGAVERKLGKLEVAAGGTLFLDEVGELPPGVQARLLRVLQERSFERVGGHKTIVADVRILAATNRDLEREVQQGRFREDLYYRLNVVSWKMPALRERREDILPLASFFAGRHGEALRGKAVTIGEAAAEALLRHSWPGNVRELANAIERAIVLGAGPAIDKADLPDAVLAAGSGPSAASAESPEEEAGFQAAVGRFKKSFLRQTLEAQGGNVTRAAEVLGLHPNHLHRLLTSFGLR